METDFDKIMEMMAEYVEGDIEGRTPEVFSAVEYFYNGLQEEIMHDRSYYATVQTVLNGFQITHYDSEVQEERYRAFCKVKKVDVAWITANVGFYYGMVCAENMRLHFYERKANLEDVYGGE